MSQASFLHLSDLHLDTPFDSVSYLPTTLKESLKNASFQAFKNAVNFALDSQSDAVIISGDIYDGLKTSTRAQVFFKECLEVLSQAGIYSIIAHGNHDLSTDWVLITDWPERVIFLPEVGFGGIKLKTRDGEILNIIGSSGVFDGVGVLKQEISSIIDREGLDPSKVTIAVLHSDISGRPPAGANYTSLTPTEFSSLPVDYWALGHLHNFDQVNKDPHIVYSGTIQGRSLKPSECGAKGGAYVTIENSKIKNVSFKKFSVIEFDQVTLRIDKALSQGDMILEVRNQLREIGLIGTQIVRLNIITKAENRRTLNTISREEEFLGVLRDAVFAELGVAIESINWKISKEINSALSREIIESVNNLIETDFRDGDFRLSEILNAEPILRGVNTELDESELIISARDRVVSLLVGGNER